MIPGAHSADVVIGAAGGIGRALTAALAAEATADSRPDRVIGVARAHGAAIPGATLLAYDPESEAGIEAMARALLPFEPRMIIIATGILAPQGRAPEKALRDFSAETFLEVIRLNTVLPALLLKHLMPITRLPGRRLFAVLSARVGSISDNRLGGWHSYRASKAALNMIVRNAAIEATARNKDAIILGLHPGTVDTELSKPFQRGVAPEKLFTPEYAAGQLLGVLREAKPQHAGRCYDYAGKEIDP